MLSRHATLKQAKVWPDALSAGTTASTQPLIYVVQRRLHYKFFSERFVYRNGDIGARMLEALNNFTNTKTSNNEERGGALHTTRTRKENILIRNELNKMHKKEKNAEGGGSNGSGKKSGKMTQRKKKNKIVVHVEDETKKKAELESKRGQKVGTYGLV